MPGLRKQAGDVNISQCVWVRFPLRYTWLKLKQGPETSGGINKYNLGESIELKTWQVLILSTCGCTRVMGLGNFPKILTHVLGFSSSSSFFINSVLTELGKYFSGCWGWRALQNPTVWHERGLPPSVIHRRYLCMTAGAIAGPCATGCATWLLLEPGNPPELSKSGHCCLRV